MRRVVVAWAALLALVAAVQAAERSPARLMPGDAAIYVELNLSQLTGDTPVAGALREAFRQSQLLAAVRTLLADDPAAVKALERALELAGGVAKTIGPRVGVSARLDLATIMASGKPAPEVLMVADVKDGEAFLALLRETLLQSSVPAAGLDAEVGTITSLAGDKAFLVRGPDWIAFGFPRAAVEKVAGLHLGWSAASLAADPGFQRALVGLPKDPVVLEYISGKWLRQISATAGMVLPEVSLPPAPEEGLAWAGTLAVEQREGRQMITAAWTTDLGKTAEALEAVLAIRVIPAWIQARESARKAQCLVNVKQLALAMQMYLADYDQFPQGEGWVEALTDYGTSDRVLKCPDDQSGARCSYGMNSGLSGATVSVMGDPGRKVVIYETARPGDNPTGGKSDVASPPRHMGGNNYGFGDGHAKWCRDPDEEAVEW